MNQIIGAGGLGGKAQGLTFFADMLEAEHDPGQFPEIAVAVPRFSVLATDMFDAFCDQRGLGELARTDLPDEEIAAAFAAAPLPAPVAAHLVELVERATGPLAVRSSSLLEDAVFNPFAGVYATKMVPNQAADPARRLANLADAVRLVWASTFFRGAKGYRRASGRVHAEEKMAVIVQELVGARHGERFYPHLSGVARSHDVYPVTGGRREDGIVNLALGLGKTIVDGSVCWAYSPGRPAAPPPHASPRDQLRNTQSRFWAVRLGREADADPFSADEHMVECDLAAAEADGVLDLLASTYDARRDRVVPGTGEEGPRVLTFAPLLVWRRLPLNDVIRSLLAMGQRAAGADVEIEFALTLPEEGGGPARLGFLQIRPLRVSHEEIQIDEAQLASPELLLASGAVMGNGASEDVSDVLFVKPESFEAKHTRAIAAEVERLNAALVAERRPSLLIGFGRWGSSDPWLGVPVAWDQIASARAIVESTLPAMNVDPSQGSHFFHNLTSFRVSYFSVRHDARPGIDWEWLAGQPIAGEGTFVRHARLARPLRIRVDGRSGRGAIWR